MIVIGWWGRKKRLRSADPVAYYLTQGDPRQVLCPAGYRPLDQNEEVRKCAYRIADLISSMTIMLMANGPQGDVRLKNELAKKVDIHPNKDMTRKNFIFKIVLDLLLRGNSVVYPQYREGLLANLQLWDMDQVMIDGDETGYTIRYRNVPFDPQEVLHFVLIPDGKKPFLGQGYAAVLKDTVVNLLQANATKTSFLRSKWQPSLIISVDADVQELQNPDRRRKILDSYTQTTEMGEPWLLPGGEARVETVRPLTLQDLALQESILLDKKAVAAAFGAPPFLLGAGEFQKEEYNNFIATVIMPIAQSIQQEFTRKLVYAPGWYFKFNCKSLLQYDLAEKTAFVKEMVAGGMLHRNEGRNEFDYSPVDDVGMNQFIVLENYLPIADVGKQKKLVQKGEGKDG